MKSKKSALLKSLIALLLCLSMLVGTTFAWFTDSVSTGINTIAAGNLDVELYHTNAATRDEKVDDSTDLFLDLQGEDILWEPGVVSYENLRICNEGDLALAYQMSIATANENHIVDPSGAIYGLSQILKVGVVEGGITATDRAGVVASVGEGNWITLGEFLRSGSLLPEGEGKAEDTWGVVIYWQPGEDDNRWNLNNGKVLDQGEALQIDLGINLIATQEVYESDSFGSDYDTSAKAEVFPEFVGGSSSAPVVPDGNNCTSEAITMTSGDVTAVVPAGAQLAPGTTQLTLTVTEMEATGSNVQLNAGEAMRSLDVHIEGVDPANTAPITVALTEVVAKGLNMGNYKLYHVENGTTNEMTLVDSAADFSAHNQFKYDPATGNITLYMASFSEVAIAAEPAKWKGGVDHSWYVGKSSPYTIANADQLWSFSQIVGGMAKINNEKVEDDFLGQTIKLISDINLNDVEGDGKIFYPIGYYNSTGSYNRTSDSVSSNVSSFSGTFDGNGHTISDFYQNTWEMFGDYNSGYSGTPNYYKDAMGLFGYVNGGTVKNLTVDRFSSDGEYTPTGVIAAYAAGDAKFENIAITNCNPRVYNTGNGGIIGIAGNTSGGDNITLENITVNSTNKITALWGSWDVACGGLAGMFRGNENGNTISFKNCHVAAQIDVYNDVCANYQYYAYRYSGMMIGSVRNNVTDNGHSYPNMAGISAEGCTVHYETWNDYYYCELEANSKASYTHDHQFSRLERVAKVDGNEVTYLNGDKETITGTRNFVVVNGDHATENATCYHFVNGQIWNHSDAGTETVNGVEIDVEDHAHIYLPFRQLFTGYGWGVTSKWLDAFNGVGVTERDTTDMIDKFEKNAALTGDFLYRVGNKNPFPIGKLFQKTGKDAVVDSGVYVSVESLLEGVNLVGTFVKNESDWTQSTLHITGGTGPAKLIIQDYNNCEPFELIVEVVDANNITSAQGSNGTDVVLLNNVKISANGTVHYQNCAVYGNGFTFDVSGGMNMYNSKQGNGIIMTKGATIDHLVVVGDVYDTYGAYTEQEDYTSAFDATNTTFTNCYIANCASPIRGNGVTLVDTTLYGGTVANLILSSGINTLENVKTVNYNDDRNVVGLGIVVSDTAADTTRIVLKDSLVQYNFVCETDVTDVPGDEAKAVFNSMFNNSFSKYHIGNNPKYVNTGIIIMSESLNTDIITGNIPNYEAKDNALISITAYGLTKTVDGAVYTLAGNNASINNNYVSENDLKEQGDYLPTPKFALGNQTLPKDNDDDTNYLIGDINGVEAMYEEGSSPISLDLNKLMTVTKYENVSYEVTAKCLDVNGKEVPSTNGLVTLSAKGSYTLEFTVNDNIFYDTVGNQIDKSVIRTYRVPLVLNVYQKAIADATITIGSSDLTGAWGGYSGNWTYNMYPLNAISDIKDDANKDGILEGFAVKENIASVELSPASNNAFSAATTVTITYNGGQVLEFVLGTPSGCSSPGDKSGGKTLSASIDSANGIKITSNGKINSKCTGTWPITSWSFKGTSQKTVTNTTNVNIAFSAESGGGTSPCVTSDTLVTLVDGTQKRIDQVAYTDQLLVWNFYKGEYTAVPAAIIFDHGYDNNTVIKLNFSDGTSVKVVNLHQFFDADLNKLVSIDADSVADYVGHKFVKQNGNGYKTVKLVDYTITEEYCEAWGIISAEHYNIFVEGMLSADFMKEDFDLFNYFEVGQNMKFDEAKMQADIAKYGLYTYADFAEYLTYEQFAAFNVPYFKIAVGRGDYTYEGILKLIETYLSN